MKCEVFDEAGDALLYTAEADPQCGHDFCDRCGDCLHCYQGDGCYRGFEWSPDAPHRWVIYGEDEAMARGVGRGSAGATKEGGGGR